MEIVSDASLSLCSDASYLLVNGNLKTSSEQGSSNHMTAGIVEVKGDMSCTKYASAASFSLKGTKLILSGDEPQTVDLRNGVEGCILSEVDMTEAAGVTFTGDWLGAGQIKGFGNIRNSNLAIQGLHMTMNSNEIFNGRLPA